MISIVNRNCRKEYFPATLKFNHLETIIDEMISDAPNHKLSPRYNAKSVRNQLKKIYGSKCAFCESDWTGNSFQRVDHYRPKKYVKEVIDKNAHFGYYWLSLEWTNLIQTCEACNTKKSNHFPLRNENSRVNAIKKEKCIVGKIYRDIFSKPLVLEERLLLHPELDKVERHLAFLRDGRVEPKNGSDMGQMSIEVYGLNRGDLILKRKKKIDRYFSRLVRILNDYEDNGANQFAKEFLRHDLRVFFREMLDEQEESREYSRVGYYMLHNFKEFYIDHLNEFDEYQQILTKFYNELIK